MPAEVVSVRLLRRPVTSEAVPELYELFKLRELPLAQTDVAIELKGVSTAVVNALRRTVLDEMPGRALRVPPDGFSFEQSTDPFMLPTFVIPRISHIPLRCQISPDIVAGARLRLNVTNRSATDLSVYSGDLEFEGTAPREPLFNPTFRLAVLGPGKQIVINGIHIAVGYGRDAGAFNVARRAVHMHLDLPQHTDAEMREEKGVAADLSGYKVSCMVADPRHHRLVATIPATSPAPAEARAVFADGCANIKERLRLIAAAVEQATTVAPAARHGIQYTVIQLEGGLTEGVLQVPGETYTIGELLKRTVSDMVPEISCVTSLVIVHENRLVVSVRHTDDVTRILLAAIQRAIVIFDEIRQGITDAR
jgi:hypothetical protein